MRRHGIIYGVIAETIPQLRTMGAQEKFQLAAELWEEVMQHEDRIADPAGIEVILKQRLASHEAGEMTGRSWEEVRSAIQSGK